MDLVARLCDEYEMCVAIHNHAKPVFGIEYEQHGETRPDLAKCLAFIDKVAAKLMDGSK